jgi:hypothetical protein
MLKSMLLKTETSASHKFCSALLDKYSITLCVIQSSGQAELVERCMRNPAAL